MDLEKTQHPESNSGSSTTQIRDHVVGHVLIVSYPLQGHAAPLMKLAYKICRFGVRVTFFTTEFALRKMASDHEQNRKQLITFASVPDGLEPDDDRKNLDRLGISVHSLMPGYLEDFIRKANNESKNGSDKFSGYIADSTLAYTVEIAKKFGIKSCATYWCSSPGCLALVLNIEKLIQAKVIDANDGTALINEKIPLLPGMRPMSPEEFTWTSPGNLPAQISIFQFIQSLTSHMDSKSDMIICNWFNELDPSVSSFSSKILPVGPLLADGNSAGSLFSEDSSCLTWLDKQSPASVVYAAFGSTSRFSQEQINEIALGLELMDRPFLWVAWSGLAANGTSSLTFPNGFIGRVADRGKVVDWAPQERVLAHPSVACFVSHCGWGSTMETISMGIPLLCWSYGGDQLYIQTCICEAWKIGIGLNAGENGIISRNEIKEKLDKLLSDTSIRSNILKLKELARKSISKGGSSFKNLELIVSQMKY